MMRLHALVYLTNAACSLASGLLPIFFMHGLNGKASWFDSMQDWIRQKHGNVTMFSFPIAEEKGSLLNLWDTGSKVMDSLRAKVTEAPHLYENGYALVCHSQGALLCRTIVERMDDHNVHTLIALAGPQQGVYGIPSGWQDYLPWARDDSTILHISRGCKTTYQLPITGMMCDQKVDYFIQ